MRKALIFALLALSAALASAQTVFPFQGLGNAQFFDNNGKPLTAGVLYSYQAGTSTQQATYTDSTGTVLNPNPIPFGSGARVSIWLTAGAYYKFVLCLQNDGPSCAPADVLFSVDQVPGSPGSTSLGNTFTGTFISGSASPATSGILRLASGDQICWRNAAGTANLCIFKDSSDVLGWQGGVFKLPEVGCTNAALGYDYLCASSTNHRLMQAPNNGPQAQLVQAGVDINTSDQVTQLHFGSSAAPLGALPSSGQFLEWNGSSIVGAGALTPLSIANDTITGTTLNSLTKVINAPSAAVVIGTSDTSGILGITIAGAGQTGNATVQQTGIATCNFDGATTAGHYFNASTTVGGDCHDLGTSPGGLGIVLSTNAVSGAYQVVLLPDSGGMQRVIRDFSTTGCSPPTSTDGSCTGSITISPAFADANYIPQLTINSVNGAFLEVSVRNSLAAGSIPYTITCSFNCSSIVTPTIYVHAVHP